MIESDSGTLILAILLLPCHTPGSSLLFAATLLLFGLNTNVGAAKQLVVALKIILEHKNVILKV